VGVVMVRSTYNVALNSLYVVNRGPRKALEQDRWHDTMDGLYSFCWGAQERWIWNHASNYCTVA